MHKQDAAKQHAPKQGAPQQNGQKKPAPQKSEPEQPQQNEAKPTIQVIAPAAGAVRSKPGYSPALDGLRALAVIAVIAYHLGYGWAPGGLLGVTVFFVLSGYLITSLLVSEHQRNGRIAFGSFWMRRARRLLPAVILVIVVTVILCMIFNRALLTKMKPDIIPSLFFFNNWWQIFHDVSYFEALGAPSPLQHFWSLGIEEQFYLVWPLLVGGILLLSRSHKVLRSVALGLAVVSIIAMALLYEPGGDPSRVYYGTDTRAFSLLIGAWLAFVFPARRLRGEGKHGLSANLRQVIGIIGIVALVVMIAFMVLVNAFSPFMYYGGILIVSVCTGLVIMALVNPESILARIFSFAPLVYIGKISYGIYLWHYPLLLLMNDFNATEGTHPFLYFLQMLLIVAVSMVSYHFVEQPIRHGCLGRMYHEVRDRTTTWAQIVRTHIIQVVVAVAIIVGAVVACIIVPDTATQQGNRQEEGVVIPEGALESVQPTIIDDGIFSSFAGEGVMDRQDLLSVLGNSPIIEHLSDATLHQLAETKGTSAESKAHDTRFLMIGDSVSVSLTEEVYGGFSEYFPYAILDAKASRRVNVAIDVYNYYVEQGWDGPVIILALSTNGTVTQEALNKFLDDIPEGKAVFIVNAQAAGDNDLTSNEAIEHVVANHGNVALINWFSASIGHDNYFDGDGTHLTATYGHDAYLNMILSALETLYK